jgi:hypothetical protein
VRPDGRHLLPISHSAPSMGTSPPRQGGPTKAAMSRTRHDHPDDEEDDDWDESDGYDAETDYDPDDPETYPPGLYADDERALVPCPHCRAEIDEEAEQCPRCGLFLSREDAPPQGKSAVWIVLMVLALLAALAMVLG